MQLTDATNTSVLELQEKAIVNNLLEYHAELQPGERKICCFGKDVPTDVDIDDILNIELKASQLLEQNFQLEDGCIFANKDDSTDASYTLTIGLNGRCMLKDGTPRTSTIYVQQKENEPYNHFRIFRHDNIDGHFVKTEIPVTEDSADFILLLMHVLGENSQPLELETEMNKAALKRDLENLERRLVRGTDVKYQYSKKYDLRIVRNNFGELVLDFIAPNSTRFAFRIRRFKNVYVFNSKCSETLEGDNRTIPDMDLAQLNVYRKMVAASFTSILE